MCKDLNLYKKNSETICRICYEHNGENENDVLISPCRCVGSLKYIHINCLKYWMKNRAIINNFSFGYTSFWKNLECELCHMSFPGKFQIDFEKTIFFFKDVIKVDKEEIFLIDCEKTDNIDMILEYIPQNKAKTSRILYFFDFSKKKNVLIVDLFNFSLINKKYLKGSRK